MKLVQGPLLPILKTDATVLFASFLSLVMAWVLRYCLDIATTSFPLYPANQILQYFYQSRLVGTPVWRSNSYVVQAFPGSQVRIVDQRTNRISL
jgi:SNF family Na+-dependent transporter